MESNKQICQGLSHHGYCDECGESPCKDQAIRFPAIAAIEAGRLANKIGGILDHYAIDTVLREAEKARADYLKNKSGFAKQGYDYTDAMKEAVKVIETRYILVSVA